MRIAMDIRTLGPQHSGVGNYVLNLLAAMHRLSHANQFHLVGSQANLDILPFEPPQEHVIQTDLSFESHPAGDLWESLVLPGRLGEHQVDVFHGPAVLMPLWAGPARVATIHDLVPFLFRKTIPAKYGLYMRWLLRKVAAKASRIIAVSRHTANDITRILRVPEKRIRVVHEAARAGFAPPAQPGLVDEALERYGIERPYVLHLGNIEPRKNLPRLIEAFEQANQGLATPARLVVVGRKAWLSGPLLRRVNKLDRKGQVVFTGYLPSADLPLIMAGAEVFAFPSIYEGFGLPALEAMACGTPVLAGDAGSLPEVVGEAALLVDPLSVTAIAQGLSRLLASQSLRDDYGRAGLERAGQFSWRKAAEETMAVYQEALGEV